MKKINYFFHFHLKKKKKNFVNFHLNQNFFYENNLF